MFPVREMHEIIQGSVSQILCSIASESSGGLAKTYYRAPPSTFRFSSSEIRPKNMYFQQIPGDSGTTFWGSSLGKPLTEGSESPF